MSTFRITPIGTCRIHTPLRRAATRYPIEVDPRRNYGFVHTSEEAVQLVRFLQGDKKLQPQVAPLVARDGDLARYEAEEWQPSDLHIVEISSSKRISCAGDAVQGNYVYHHFADFFANSERSKSFWALVRKAHRREFIHFLREQRSYRTLSAVDRELLMNLQIEPQTFKAIKSDMAEIVERLGRDKVMFVTHVNATTPDEELIPARDRLIRWVQLAAEQLEVPVFDPTPAMQDFGQEKALERGGLDLTHYTPAFSDAVYDEMHRVHIAPLVGSAGGETGQNAAEIEVARQAAKLEAMLEISDFFAASRSVHAAIAEAPDALPLIELRGMIRSRIGDFPGAIADLTRRGDDSALSQAMRVGLVEALNATDQPGPALKVAENLLAEEYESPGMYRAAAEAAERLGKIDEAIGYAKQAFRNDRDDLAAALHALVLLNRKGSAEEMGEWRSEILENVGASANGAFEAAMWAIEHRDEELFAAALLAVALVDKGSTVELLEDGYNAGMYRGVALSLELAANLGRLPRSMAARRLAIIEGSLEAARTLSQEGRSAEAFALASAIAGLDGVSSSQIPTVVLVRQAVRLIRDITQKVRTSIRVAYKSHDTEEALRVGEAAGDLLLAVPEGAVLFARSLHGVGNTDRALAFIKRAHAANPENFAIQHWTARLAMIAADYTTALRVYGDLRRSNDPAVATIQVESDRFFASVEGRALKQLRQLVQSGHYRSAIALARLIGEELAAEERVERELGRMHSLLRRRMKEIDEGEADVEEREGILRYMTQIRPSDERVLRRYALELMRQFRFAEAAEMWDRLYVLNPSNATAARQRERCAKMARRRVAAWGSDLEAVA